MTSTSTPNKISKRDQFLSDVITTAVEGGVNYWAIHPVYEFSLEGEYPTYTEVIDFQDSDFDFEFCLHTGTMLNKWDAINIAIVEGQLKVHKIDTNEIAKAIKAIINDEAGVNDQIVCACFVANRMNDAGDIDCEVADCIMQMACFGEVKYG